MYGVENVQEVIDFLEGKGNLEPTTIQDTLSRKFQRFVIFPEFMTADGYVLIFFAKRYPVFCHPMTFEKH
jgi:hypothetical protein